MRKALAALAFMLMAAPAHPQSSQGFISYPGSGGGGGFSSAGAGIPVDTTGSNNWAARCLAAGTGIAVANECGAAGNFTITLDTAVVPLFSSGTATASATGAIGTFYFETDAGLVSSYSATDTLATFLTVQTHFIDEDSFASDSATKVPSQQSVKAYVDANAGGVNYATTAHFFDEMFYETTTPDVLIERAMTTQATENIACPTTLPGYGCYSVTAPAVDNGGSAYNYGFVTDAATGDWSLEIRFRVSSVTSMAVWVGMITDGTAGSRQPLLSSGGVWIRFDTDAGDTLFTGQVCDAAGAAGCQSTDDDTDSAIFAGSVTPAADTWYKAIIRLDQTGVGGVPTYYMSVNGETEFTFCSSGCSDSNADAPAADTFVVPFFALATRDVTGTEVLYVDYLYLTATR